MQRVPAEQEQITFAMAASEQSNSTASYIRRKLL